ncbi:phytochelatin synthase family protein [Adhaeretor mobilis]|uniref:glutathione gamma-glutamylcysteinyltransferase n=1 Tax=Adhaeretor mobilis TaxID=1930276 RepID=A0A517N364_9BACT|nr:phytochelatin synthase family protein [Adhaeretor mobilis]QDT01574.1 Phytochelatin synthase [Adhaeretor mobilis]
MRIKSIKKPDGDKNVKTFILLGLLMLLTSRAEGQPDDLARMALGDHWRKKEVIKLDSKRGKQLLNSIDRSKFDALKKYWEPQLPAYCGVCSGVIVTNTLKNSKALNQSNFFSPAVREIIPPETVSRIGLTLRELQTILAILNPQFIVEKHYTFNSGLDLFKEHLKKDKNSDGLMITNFSIESLLGTGMRVGHFSIVAGYHEEEKMVLILEVSEKRNTSWIKSEDMFTAMSAVDPVSRIPRGWINVKPPAEPPVE